MVRPTLLLDSPSLAYRSYFGVPSSVRDPSGRPVNAVRGYLDMTSRLLTERRPAGIVHAFDLDWRPAFRVAAYPGYKAQRRDDPEDLPHQFDVLRALLTASGMPLALAEGYEADDVLGTLAARADDTSPVEIVTGDRDMLQLVRDPAVAVLFTVRGVSVMTRFDETTVRERYGVPPQGYADMAILRGDPSDGLPGVRGIGGQTASLLIARAGSLAALLADPALAGRHAGRLAEAADYLAAMRVVVPIPTDIAVDLSPAGRPDVAGLQALGAEHGLENCVGRLLTALEVLDGAPPEAAGDERAPDGSQLTLL